MRLRPKDLSALYVYKVIKATDWENWQDYLEMLEEKYDTYNKLQNDKLLMELFGVTTEEEVQNILISDMEGFTQYMTANNELFLENQIETYRNYSSSLNEFLAEYKTNLTELYDLKQEELALMAADEWIDEMLDAGTDITTVLEDVLSGDGWIGNLTTSSNSSAINAIKEVAAKAYTETLGVEYDPTEKTAVEANIDALQSKGIPITITYDSSGNEIGWKYGDENTSSAQAKAYLQLLNSLGVSGDITEVNTGNYTQKSGTTTSTDNGLSTAAMDKKALDYGYVYVEGAGYVNSTTSADKANALIAAGKTVYTSVDSDGTVHWSTESQLKADNYASAGGTSKATSTSGNTVTYAKNEYSTKIAEKAAAAAESGKTVYYSTDKSGTLHYSTESQEKANSYSTNANKKNGYAEGILGGPVTTTGLAMLHGTPSKPEYVLNSDQAYTLLRNLSLKDMQYESVLTSLPQGGTQYIVQGDIVLNEMDNAAQFWSDVTTAMQSRYSITKNLK